MNSPHGLAESLTTLKERLVAGGSRVATLLRPGLGETSVLQALEDVDAPPHGDLVTLFGWHDGIEDDGTAIRLFPSGFFPLREILEFYPKFLVLFAGLERDLGLPARTLYDPAWVPFLWGGGGSNHCLDTRTGEVIFLDRDEGPINLAPSLDQWVQSLLEEIWTDRYVFESPDFYYGPMH